jgi:hypothetical protein
MTSKNISIECRNILVNERVFSKSRVDNIKQKYIAKIEVVEIL